MYELKLLALLDERSLFERSEKMLKAMSLAKDAKEIVRDIKIYYKDFPNIDTIDWDDFLVWGVNHRHPLWADTKKDVRKAIVENVKQEPKDKAILGRLLEISLAEGVENAANSIRQGSGSTGVIDIESLLTEFTRLSRSTDNFFVDMDVDALVKDVVQGTGIEWRLEDLNTSVGQLHHSDFVVIGKRPETGGTTFVTSEFTFMLRQLPEGKDAIIFNNEEGGGKVALRVVQSALGIKTKDILANPAQVQKDYEKFLNGRKILVYDNGGMSDKDIEAVLNDHPNCWLIGINILDKIAGFNSQSEVARFRELAWWGRRLAKKYGAVVAIAQADAEAEGMQYLQQTQLYGSKTGVQGEADIQIMIGCDHEQEHLRYFNIVKNKKPTTGRMIPAQRKAKFPAKFDIEKGRFTSLGSKT